MVTYVSVETFELNEKSYFLLNNLNYISNCSFVRLEIMGHNLTATDHPKANHGIMETIKMYNVCITSQT